MDVKKRSRTGRFYKSDQTRGCSESRSCCQHSCNSKFRFSREQVMWLSYMIDKHQDDYKAMARDKKNHFQETPKQIKGKILKFMNIPEQYAVFARERGLIEKSEAIETTNEDSAQVIEEEMEKENEALQIEEETEEVFKKDSQGKRKRNRVVESE